MKQLSDAEISRMRARVENYRKNCDSSPHKQCMQDYATDVSRLITELLATRALNAAMPQGVTSR